MFSLFPSLSLLYFPGLFTEEIDTSNQTLHRILFLLDNFTRGIVNMGPTNWDLWYQNRQEKIRKCIFISNIKIHCFNIRWNCFKETSLWVLKHRVGIENTHFLNKKVRFDDNKRICIRLQCHGLRCPVTNLTNCYWIYSDN